MSSRQRRNVSDAAPTDEAPPRSARIGSSACKRSLWKKELRPGAMGELAHRVVRANGINIHIVEQGSGPLVLLLHGFPETWYSWRYQLPALAQAGFHAVAPDIRGNGGSAVPADATHYTAFHYVADLVGLVAALGEKEVLLVGHDWGAVHAWDMCLFRPDLVKAVVALSAPFMPRLPSGSFLTNWRAVLGDDFYMWTVQQAGGAEAQFAQAGTANTLKGIFLFGQGDSFQPHFTEADLACYTESFEKTGFTGALNAYRNIDRTWELKSAWTERGVDTPALFIVGDQDGIYHLPGIQDFIHKGDFERYVPNLKESIVLEGAAHYLQQQAHERVSEEIIRFLKAF